MSEHAKQQHHVVCAQIPDGSVRFFHVFMTDPYVQERFFEKITAVSLVIPNKNLNI